MPGYARTAYNILPKHVDQHVWSSQRIHDICNADTAVQIGRIVHEMVGKFLRYQDFVALASKPFMRRMYNHNKPLSKINGYGYPMD